MSFEDIERRLPNGFHDAQIKSIGLDLIGKRLTLGLDLHVGAPEHRDPERYAPAKLTIEGACLFVVEPPDPRYSFIPNGEPLWVSGDSVQIGQSPAIDRLLPMFPEGTIYYRFFLNTWNSFLYVGGRTALLQWEDAAPDQDPSDAELIRTFEG